MLEKLVAALAANLDNIKEKLDDIKEELDAVLVAYLDNIRKKIEPKTETDNINHPSHYADGKIEVIDFIEDKKLPFHLGNVIKYISRAGKKSPDTELEDLKKAQWYLNRYVELKEENK